MIVENYIPGTLKKYGLDYPTLAQTKPGLVYASITGYGQTGPYALKAGYDVMVEAEMGLMHITGTSVIYHPNRRGARRSARQSWCSNH